MNRLIQSKGSYLLGDRFVTPADPPFEVGEDRARRLVALGLAEFVAVVASSAAAAVHSAVEPTASTETAVARRRSK